MFLKTVYSTTCGRALFQIVYCSKNAVANLFCLLFFVLLPLSSSSHPWLPPSPPSPQLVPMYIVNCNVLILQKLSCILYIKKQKYSNYVFCLSVLPVITLKREPSRGPGPTAPLNKSHSVPREVRERRGVGEKCA